ncbi:MAG: hypothetical protein JNM17_27365 [Archangium sp.]|nr:hypothetical protein [Archangium sp.]
MTSRERHSFISVAFVAMAVCALAQRPLVRDGAGAEESSIGKTQQAPRIAVAVAPVELKRVASSFGPDVALAAQLTSFATPQVAAELGSERIGASNGTARARLRAHPPHGPPAQS